MSYFSDFLTWQGFKHFSLLLLLYTSLIFIQMPLWLVRNSCSQDSIFYEDERYMLDISSIHGGDMVLYFSYLDV